MSKRSKEPPVRLDKKEEKVSKTVKMEKWINKHTHMFIFVFLIVIIILLAMLCFICIPSGTESGLWYNNDGIACIIVNIKGVIL